jgi:hypothetical protein
MAKRKGFPPIICLVLMVFFQSKSCISCSGFPSDFDSVVLHATATKIGAGDMVTITASVPRDTTGAGVTWVFTPGVGAPAPPGIFTVLSVTEATYAAPTTAVASQFTVSIQATSIAFPTETKTIVITIGQTQPLKITTTTLPNGILGTAYPAGTQMQATGGVPPYTWQLGVGSGPFPAGLLLNMNGTITGMPTATGVFNTFTIEVSDSEPTPMTFTTTAGQLSITVTNALSGSYAFEFSGFNSSGAFVAAGSFTADGVSKITNGVEDVNSIGGTPKNQAFTGTFTLTSDDRGQIIFSSLAGTPTFDFSIDSLGLHGRMVEFDSTGVRGSGQIEQQNTSTCAFNTLSGSGTGNGMVIGISGATTGVFPGITPGPVALVGRFTAEVPASSSTPGNIDTGEVDINSPQQVINSDTTFSGTFESTAQAGLCSMSVSDTLSSMNFDVYPVTSVGGLLTEAFVVETDTLTASTPYVTVGKLIQQVGYPFSVPSNSLALPSVGGLSGGVIPTGQAAFLPFVAVAQLDPTGGGGFNMPFVENVGGAVSSFQGAGVITATLNPGDTFGRVDTNLALPIAPVFYVVGPNEAFCILENINAPVIGLFEPQSTGTATTFSTGLVVGTLAAGTSAPETSLTTDFSGFNTLASTGTSTGTVAGTQDTSTSAANTADQAVAGTFALGATGTTDGDGTVTLTTPAAFTGQFFIVSPTKIALISTTAGDTNPVLIFLGNCASTCGED